MYNKIFVYILFLSTLKYNAFQFKKILFFALVVHRLAIHYNIIIIYSEIDIAKRIILCAQSVCIQCKETMKQNHKSQ